MASWNGLPFDLLRKLMVDDPNRMDAFQFLDNGLNPPRDLYPHEHRPHPPRMVLAYQTNQRH